MSSGDNLAPSNSPYGLLCYSIKKLLKCEALFDTERTIEAASEDDNNNDSKLFNSFRKVLKLLKSSVTFFLSQYTLEHKSICNKTSNPIDTLLNSIAFHVLSFHLKPTK